MNNLIKGFLAFFLIFGICTDTKSQFIEVGGGVGAMNYMGDLSRSFRISETSPSIFGIYRMNLSDAVAAKVFVGYGGLKASDENPFDALGAARMASFDVNVIEASAGFEYNFIDFRQEDSPVRWSPYFFVGFGFFRFSGFDEPSDDFSIVQPVLPFGVGFKHLIGKQWSAGIEWGARKTFFDHLDNISNGDPTLKNFQYGNPNSTDWYFNLGISITYIFWEIPCPFQYKPNRGLYRSK